MKRRSSSRRKIAVVTGTRAEYGLFTSVMSAIKADSRLELQLIVTGTHLLKKFGYTVDEIAAAGWKIDARVKMQRGDDDPLDQANGLSRGISAIAEALARLESDVVLVLGDRIEALAGALAAVTSGRLLAHIHGGDIAPGDFDDSLRHSITKLAHIHFTATQGARVRVIQMGEEPRRVHFVGAPGLDQIHQLKSNLAREDQAGKILRRASTLRNGIEIKKSALIVQHPCGRSSAVEMRVMQHILSEVGAAGLSALCIYPNSDRGHSGIIAAIQTRRRENQSAVKVFPSLQRDEYLRLLCNSQILVGNSSSGMIEAPAVGTPVVNVGSRQLGRERADQLVIDAAETRSSIRGAIARAIALGPITTPTKIYGDGTAGPRIASLLAKMPLTHEFRRKRFVSHSPQIPLD